MQPDHEYSVVVRPNLRVTAAVATDEGSLDRLTVDLEYRRDGRSDAEGEWADSDAGVELQGRRVVLSRDGEPLLDRDLSTALASGIVERYGTTAANYVRQAVGRVRESDRSLAGNVEETAEPASWPIAVTQADGTTVEAFRPPAQATFEVYEDESGAWRWRLRHQNGNVVADSGQGYSSKRAAKKGIESVKRNALGSPVEES
ncbi:HVO_2922 family protein [Halomicrococcus sp. NG-SE-24]|uniref:HVO_2922 family protein n=1 Tax=Halomicrococcus sp. NG-SE-24 TaxID=3436928 RepID=UPI003D956624